MTRFFWRIFLSTWAIAVTSLGLSIYFASWLPKSGPAFPPAEQLTELVARDLRASFAAGAVDPSDVAKRYAIDLNPFLEVFVLDSELQDVLARPVPADVYRAVVGEQVTSWMPDDWSEATVISDGLNGYTVAAYEGVFVLGRAMSDPRARVTLFVLALCISALVSLFLARFIVKPVTRLREAGRLVASGDLSVRVAPTLGKREDALAALARDFDFMTERVADSIAARQQLMRDMSHELRSPLARLQALVSIAGQREDTADHEFLGRVESELDRLDTLIAEILAFSRLQLQEHAARTRTDIVDLILTIVDDASIEAEAGGKKIRYEAPERLLLNVDHWLVHSAIENIVRNALKYTPAGTEVAIEISKSQRVVQVAVTDNGPGVPESALDAMFLPFYRVEDGRPTNTGNGGIGLAIAARAAALHGGSVVAENQKSGGLRVVFSLPCDEF